MRDALELAGGALGGSIATCVTLGLLARRKLRQMLRPRLVEKKAATPMQGPTDVFPNPYKPPA
jgi:hypothetical protein